MDFWISLNSSPTVPFSSFESVSGFMWSHQTASSATVATLQIAATTTRLPVKPQWHNSARIVLVHTRTGGTGSITSHRNPPGFGGGGIKPDLGNLCRGGLSPPDKVYHQRTCLYASVCNPLQPVPHPPQFAWGSTSATWAIADLPLPGNFLSYAKISVTGACSSDA